MKPCKWGGCNGEIPKTGGMCPRCGHLTPSRPNVKASNHKERTMQVKAYEEYAVGDRAVYTEDGGNVVVEVVENKTTDERYGFRLKVLDVLTQPYMGGPAVVGEEYDVGMVKNVAFGGMWYLATLDEFVVRHGGSLRNRLSKWGEITV